MNMENTNYFIKYFYIVYNTPTAGLNATAIQLPLKWEDYVVTIYDLYHVMRMKEIRESLHLTDKDIPLIIVNYIELNETEYNKMVEYLNSVNNDIQENENKKTWEIFNKDKIAADLYCTECGGHMRLTDKNTKTYTYMNCGHTIESDHIHETLTYENRGDAEINEKQLQIHNMFNDILKGGLFSNL